MGYANIQNIINIENIKKVVAIGIIMLLILLLLRILLLVYRMILKIKFMEKYNIAKIPQSVKIRRKKTKTNYFILRYPVWEKSKKDGTADLRVTDNMIVWQVSKLYVDGFMLMSELPYELLDVVKALRYHNVKIDLCEEEKIKYSKLLKEKQLCVQNVSIQKIVDYYKETPAEFEKFCAQLYNKMGYVSKVTPPTNDGGYDIIISDDNTTSIIECKCYSIHNMIGRPMIQKLVGANIIGADNMIFITTSGFSAAAIAYAENVGVELVDGNKLLQLIKTYMSLETQELDVSVAECQLEISDMKSYVPTDIFEEYFL